LPSILLTACACATPSLRRPCCPCPCRSPFSQRLAQGEWFTSRVSACGLFAVAYSRAAGAAQAELRQLYAQLCHDETPMVRRAAAQKLGAFAAVLERDAVSRDLLPLFTDLTSDGAAASTHTCPAAATNGNNAQQQTPMVLLPHAPHSLPCAAAMCGCADQDSVRLLAVEGCGAFAAALSKEDCKARLLPVVQKFAQVCSSGKGT
jgi:serine/threonine-protein phosphatase 2A regulatory subunit A